MSACEAFLQKDYNGTMVAKYPLGTVMFKGKLGR